MQSIDDIRKAVREWARQLGVPLRVYVFGSRLKGTNKSDSDLDIAIEALEKFGEFSDFFLWWQDHPHEDWKRKLEEITGLQVDLQQYDPAYTQNLVKFLAEASEVVFDAGRCTGSQSQGILIGVICAICGFKRHWLN